MTDTNFVELEGTLLAEPELRQTQSGGSICNLFLQTVRQVEYEGVKREFRDVHSISCWSRLAEQAFKALKSGDRVHVVGRLRMTNFMREGVKTRRTEVVATSVEPLTLREPEQASLDGIGALP
jgi:single stranded DNA-binding protein